LLWGSRNKFNSESGSGKRGWFVFREDECRRRRRWRRRRRGSSSGG
jgi:hypothetical protein